jgi:integrase
MTRSKYDYMLERHVLPVLGRQELAMLSSSEGRSWYMAMREKYLTTGDDAYRMLRAVLTTAVTDDLIVKNPWQVKGAGNARSAERPVLSVAELTAAADAVEGRYRLAVLLCAWCQLRRGEVLGLPTRSERRRRIKSLRSSRSAPRSESRLVALNPGLRASGPGKGERGVLRSTARYPPTAG